MLSTGNGFHHGEEDKEDSSTEEKAAEQGTMHDRRARTDLLDDVIGNDLWDDVIVPVMDMRANDVAQCSTPIYWKTSLSP